MSLPLPSVDLPPGVPPLDLPCALLGGLSPQAFMRRHWQKQPLLVRQAWPGVRPPVSRAELFKLAADEAVESRLVARSGPGARAEWTLSRGPLPRKALPPLRQPGWTVLVQGLDLHVPTAHEWLNRFRFVPQARLDDLMISWASEGGGVGPHFDSYDVFLLQVQGKRRWRIGRMDNAKLRPNLPVKILANFRAEQEWVLEPGDMLYLPPGWAHDGDAVDGECMTCSVGFRSATAEELARETLLRLADAMQEEAGLVQPTDLYRDPNQAATATPGRIPAALLRHAKEGVQRALREAGGLERALGEFLSEPKPMVVFDAGSPLDAPQALRLDARSCMLYDDERVFLNGESWLASGRDAAMLRELADRRCLSEATVRRGSKALKQLLSDWAACGWVQRV